MYPKFLFIFVIGIGTPVFTWILGNGTPLSACDDMMPHHVTEPQASPPPYTIIINKRQIKSGDKIKVLISGKYNEKFREFMVQARTADHNIIGNFEIDSKDQGVKPLDCSSVAASAATQKNSDEKSDIVLTWISPLDFEGEITFLTTIVQSYGIFWARIPSIKVQITRDQR